jgi:hypothetical protein
LGEFSPFGRFENLSRSAVHAGCVFRRKVGPLNIGKNGLGNIVGEILMPSCEFLQYHPVTLSEKFSFCYSFPLGCYVFVSVSLSFLSLSPSIFPTPSGENNKMLALSFPDQYTCRRNDKWSFLQPARFLSNGSRVTRLGEFLTTGKLFTLCSF